MCGNMLGVKGIWCRGVSVRVLVVCGEVGEGFAFGLGDTDFVKSGCRYELIQR